MSNPDPYPRQPDPSEPLGREDPLVPSGSFISPNNNGSISSDKPIHDHKGGSAEPQTTSWRAQRKGSDAAPSDPSSWLPPGWRVEDKVRVSGATAGSIDKYYIELSTGRRFRSKKEVLRYLETGAIRQKRKMPGEYSDGDTNASHGSGTHISKKSSKEAKRPISNFDYSNVPDSIEWVLINASEDSWTPFAGGEKVAEHERESWDEGFASVIARKSL